MNRFKNYGLYVSLASLVLIILQMCGIVVPSDKYNTIVNIILSILVGLGIISDPTSGRGYIDVPKIDESKNYDKV